MRALSTSLSLLALLTLTPLTLAQEGVILDPARLPACALTCNTLVSAQSLCVPPTAPPQGQAIYQTCFCNSNFLAIYRAGAASPACDDVCTSDADRQAILQWYTGLCTGGQVVIPNGGGATGGGAAGGPEVVGGDGTPARGGNGATATGTGSSGVRTQSSGEHKSWISTHYQWIIMIVVLLIAGIGFTFLGLWLKRRHDRKWATGGHPRDSMLRTHDVTSSLGNRHPDPAGMSMSQVYVASSRPGTLSKKPGVGVRNVS